jgi:hypothetical protein
VNKSTKEVFLLLVYFVFPFSHLLLELHRDLSTPPQSHGGTNTAPAMVTMIGFPWPSEVHLTPSHLQSAKPSRSCIQPTQDPFLQKHKEMESKSNANHISSNFTLSQTRINQFPHTHTRSSGLKYNTWLNNEPSHGVLFFCLSRRCHILIGVRTRRCSIWNWGNKSSFLLCFSSIF